MLIDITVFSLVATAVLAAYISSFKALDLAKAKIAAVALANEKMEVLRNMPYDSLATEYGPIYPPGEILDNETVTRRGIQFNVHIAISYVDDPFDGTAGGGVNDLYPYDYKKMEITVSKVGRNGYLARLTSNVAAKAAETPSNSGIIRLCVVDATGAPISQANVTITNPDVAPPVNISTITGNDGCILVSNLPPDHQNRYHLTATKDGFSTDMTIPRTAQNPNALFPDVDVIIQQITSQTLSIDKKSSLLIDVLDTSGQPVPNSTVHIEGTKLVYFNPSTPKYSANLVTDSNGHLEIPNMEFDSYKITVQGQTILTTSPYQPIDLKPDVILPVKITVGGSSLPSINSCEPMVGKMGEVVSLKIIGANFSNATIKLVNNSNQEIIGTNVEILSNKEINADFNLTGAATGLWNIVIQNSTGSTTQINGFTVVQ